MAAGALIAAMPLVAGAAAPGVASARDYAPGRILVAPRAGLSPAALAKSLAPFGGVARKLGQGELYIVTLPPSMSERAVVERLAHDPHMKFAELDRRVKSTAVPNDPYYGSAWHLAKIGASTAWDNTMGAGITIAILDSGIDSAHPDLMPNLVAGYNVYNSNNDTSDVCGHGTAVAGTAAAAVNNGVGVAGIAGQAKIMPLRVAYFDSSMNSCYAYYSTVASGLTYAADHGARIANVSYGGVAGSAAIQNAAQYMKNKGGLVFVSAGNNGINENLVPTATMIPVSGTDSNDVLSSWSSYGSFVALSAPGAGLWSTSRGGLYQSWTGTSFSSPLTAGVAALMMSANPALDGSKIESLMFSSALDLGAAGRDIYYGHGRVNASAAVAAAVSAIVSVDTQAPSASISAPLASSTVSGLVAVNVSATDNVGVARVELQVNGATIAIDSIAPYGFTWDSTGGANGMTTLKALAYDAAGNVASSTAVSVNVANAVSTPVLADTTPPLVTIVNPVAGAVAGNVSVSVQASDNSGAAGISQQLFINDVLKASSSGAALSYSWNTRKVSSGAHILKAVARDAAGNSSTVSVTVTRK